MNRYYCVSRAKPVTLPTTHRDSGSTWWCSRTPCPCPCCPSTSCTSRWRPRWLDWRCSARSAGLPGGRRGLVRGRYILGVCMGTGTPSNVQPSTVQNCLPLTGGWSWRSVWGSTSRRAARRTGGRPPGGAGWTRTGRRSGQGGSGLMGWWSLRMNVELLSLPCQNDIAGKQILNYSRVRYWWWKISNLFCPH